MRSINVVAGGTLMGIVGLAGTVLIPTAPIQASGSTPPDKISLTGKIRDFANNNQHPDFLINPSATPGARSADNIGRHLDGEKKPAVKSPRTGKRVNTEWRDANNEKIAWCLYEWPEYRLPGDQAGEFQGNGNFSDLGGIATVNSFSQWFRDVPGLNMSRLWTIHLDRQSDGSYYYGTNDFNPIDHQLLGNGNQQQNYYFTYEVVFTFVAAPNQYIWHKGSDDCWVFVEGPGITNGSTLVIDHGGIAANREQMADLNRLNLTAGEQYKMYIFYAERSQPQSQFYWRTNIIPYTPPPPPPPPSEEPPSGGSEPPTTPPNNGGDVDTTIFAAFD